MAEAISPRERVLAALNHQESDRVPIDFSATHNSGINVLAYNRLKKQVGVDTPTYMRDPIPMLASPDLEEGMDVIRMMGGDLLPLPRHLNFGVPAENWQIWDLKDGSQCLVPGGFKPVIDDDGSQEMSLLGGLARLKMPARGHHFNLVSRPLGTIENLAQLENLLPFLRESGAFSISDEELKVLKLNAQKLRTGTDFALVATGGPLFFSLYQVGQELFGYEKFFTFMAADPELIHCWLEFLASTCIERLNKYLAVLAPYLDIILMGDDYGFQNAPQMSPQMFRELFKPYLVRVCRAVKDFAPDLKILLHSCGSIAPYIPDFIEAGIDALNPVQINAAGMDPIWLKKEFGRQITFWGGGVRTQTTLVRESPAAVAAEVRELIDIFKPGGGYIFCPIHDIQEEVPPEKILAIYETARKYAYY
ncbi:MAG: uroporphyrinogen decarboxylase family protein [Bacillota bacterium]|nr:uroporphyrinogen decarboxylase family protein [Bacillota bacterium]